MAEQPPPLVFDAQFEPHTGESVEVLPGVARVTASNAGPFTFTGTNSFIIGVDQVAVLDPGPTDTAHHEALLAAISGRQVEAILLTHTHRDHSAGARALSEATGAPLWFGGPHRLSRKRHWLEFNPIGRDCDWDLYPARTLVDGERFTIGGIELTAIATPGHCANHLAFGIGGTDWLLTGDHIMGWNSTLVATPDGSMADYLASLHKVLALPYRHYLPAHGGEISDGPSFARALLAHRELRNRQIVDAVNAGVDQLDAIVSRLYPTLKARLRFAARLTVTAHLEYLAERGLIRMQRTLLGLRLSRVN